MPALVTPANPYVFASLNVPDAKDVMDAKTELSEEDPVSLARIYAFDAFIHNTDRTDFNSNLLINDGIHAIDHNNAFDPAFDPREFARTHILRDSFVSVSNRDKKEFEDLVRGTITADFLASAWSEMPDAWTDAGSDVFSFESILSILGLEAR